MNGFLSNLVARNFTDAPVIQPRVPSLFETAADEFFGEQQLSTKAIGAPEMEALPNAPPPIPKISPMNETAATAPTTDATNVSDASDMHVEGHLPRSDVPEHKRAPLIAKPPQADKQADQAQKLEIETRKVVPVDSLSDGKSDAGRKDPTLERFSEPRSIQPRRRKDFPPVDQRSSASAPIIRVTIGRIEVRAVHQPAPAPKLAKPVPPKLSLDEYLRGGKR